MAAAIGEESMELEAMRKEDRSWHPCRVSLSAPATLSVIIGSKNYSEEYIITSKDEVLLNLRYRSIPLQDGECCNVEEGDQVLAMNKDQGKHLFFDAVIEEVRRVKHSKRVYCRCTFEVKWLHSEGKLEAVVLSSNLIMKLSRKSIDSHSVVAEFLSSTNSACCASNIFLLEERTPEADIQGIPEYDLQGLLEKQIEEISRFADLSNENCMEEAVIGYSKDVTKISTLNGLRNLRSSSRARMRESLEFDVKKQIEDPSLLTPLAARAALASLMHELPNSSEFSDSPEKKKVFADVPSSFKNMAHTLNTSHLSQEFNARMLEYVSESKSTVLRRKNITRSLNHSEPKRNPECQKPTRKFIHSATQKRNQDSDNEIGRKCLGEEGKGNMRLTRSMAEKRNQNSVEDMWNKCHGKNKGAEPPVNGKPLTALSEKGMPFSVSPIHQEPNNKQLIQEMQLDEVVQTPANLEINGKMVAPPTFDENSLSTKGTKRTRLEHAFANHKVNKEEMPVDNNSHPDKKKSGSSKKPQLRFSARLRLLQSNSSQN